MIDFLGVDFLSFIAMFLLFGGVIWGWYGVVKEWFVWTRKKYRAMKAREAEKSSDKIVLLGQKIEL